MQTAKLFMNGRSQAVRLPKDFQFEGTDVIIRRHGDAVILTPHDKAWEVFRNSLEGFTDDIFEDGRNQGEDQIRESL